MSYDNLELVRAIDAERRTRRRPPIRPLERRRRRHSMARALHGLADRIDG